MLKSWAHCYLIGLFLVVTGLPATAGETKVAVASNFTAPAKEIARAFAEKTGHRAILIFGSTGKLYAQISQGAPFELYLAANSKHPQRAEEEGLAIAATRFTYARGKVLLYSSDPTLRGDKEKLLASDKFSKIAIANPISAPYGTAAVETMKRLGVYDKLVPKIVKGDNIAQTYQFVATGNAQLGFVSLSQVINTKGGSRWAIPDDFYTPIKQDAVLLKKGADSIPAKAFLVFLKSDAAYAIIKKYGYGLK